MAESEQHSYTKNLLYNGLKKSIELQVPFYLEGYYNGICTRLEHEIKYPCSVKNVKKRKYEFYREKMMWVINGTEFKNNFNFHDIDHGYEWWMDKTKRIETDSTKKSFSWAYPRRSWEDVSRPVFIDFGKQSLFWVKEGMGKSGGKGMFILKEKFIEKYGGSFDYYSQKNK